MAKPITIGGRTFPTQKAATEAIRAELAPWPLEVEFRSDLLSELAAEHHYYLSRVGLRPARHRKVRHPDHPTGYELQGWFEGIGWHDWSWTKCLRQPTWQQDVTAHLRRLVKPLMDEARGAACERCGERVSILEVHHKSPEFKEMVAQVLPLITPAEALSYRDWKGKTRYELPPGHPIEGAFLALHAKAKLETLCRPHHWEATKGEERDSTNTP